MLLFYMYVDLLYFPLRGCFHVILRHLGVEVTERTFGWCVLVHEL